MRKVLPIILVGCLILPLVATLTSCSQDKDKDKEDKAKAATEQTSSSDAKMTSISLTPGEAGGTIDETINASATVKAIDAKTRKITLVNQDGTEATFTAPAEMQNFDQLHVGDKVNATVNSRLSVLVSHRGDDPNAVHTTAVMAAPKGAKPGAIVAEQFEITATVKAIDTTNRRATLEFADGERKVVPVRSDVDLSQYHVGDTVHILITQQLMVVAEAP